MNKLQWIVGVVLILMVIGIAVWVWLAIPKTAYINTEEVYNDFKLKKELEQKLKKTESTKAKVLDSLRMELQLLSEDIQGNKVTQGEKINKFNILKRNYLGQEEAFAKQQEELTAQYSSQIWKQLNQFVKEFGENNHYDYIYGVHGQGNLMYASEQENITSEVKEFVNDKYEGNIK